MAEDRASPDAIAVAPRAGEAIESVGGAYFFGGSLASSLQGDGWEREYLCRRASDSGDQTPPSSRTGIRCRPLYRAPAGPYHSLDTIVWRGPTFR